MAHSRSRTGLDWDWNHLRAIAYREARQVLGDPDRAQDAAQEAAARAWRNASACRGAEAGSWIRTIARREALRIAARRDEPPTADAPASSCDTADVGARLDVQSAVARLRPIERRLILEHYWGDLTCAEIARRLQMPEGTVKIRLHRARRRLAEALGT